MIVAKPPLLCRSCRAGTDVALTDPNHPLVLDELPRAEQNGDVKVLLILNDGPYGTERSYNGLRLALALVRTEGTEIRVFLMADAVGCAKPGQATPQGSANIGRMIKGLTTRGVAVGACGTCMDARGFTESDLAEGVHRSSMAELAVWTLETDRTLVW